MNTSIATKTKRPKCVGCHERPARLGKEQGYEANLYCTLKCAYKHLMLAHMDDFLCTVCGEWERVCGGCSSDEQTAGQSEES